MSVQLIECPKCGTKIPVSKALSESIEAKLQAKFDSDSEALRTELAESFEGELKTELEKAKIAERKAADKESSAEIAKLTEALKTTEKREEKAKAEFDKRLEEERQNLVKIAKDEARRGSADQTKQLRKQIRDGRKEIEELLAREEKISKKEAALQRKEKRLQKQIDKAITKATDEATESLREDVRLKERGHQKIVTDLNKQLDDAKRKLGQGSQELQGEVLELELEKALQAQFPQDSITPVKKGARGADINHEVITGAGSVAGSIIWETKNTKNWAKTWITKLKSDQRKAKADVAVIVSKALPPNMKSRFEYVNGIWICEYSVVIGLATALRMSILEVSRLRQSAQGKDEKMEILYQYLMSTAFKQRVESMVESFMSMKTELDKERAAMEKSWANREGQINQVMANIAGMVGDIQSRAPSFPPIERLQLPGPD